MPPAAPKGYSGLTRSLAFSMFVSGNAFDMFYGDGDEKSIFVFIRVSLSIIPLITIITHFKYVLENARGYTFLTILFIYTGAAQYFASNIYNSYKGFLHLILSAIFGLAIAVTHPPWQAARAILFTLLFMIFISITWIIIVPETGLHQGDDFVGQWRGVYSHKNIFGPLASLCAAMLIYSGRMLLHSRMVLYVCLFVSMICVAEARSVSSYFTILLAVLFIASDTLEDRYSLSAKNAFWVAAIAVSFIIIPISHLFVLDMLGRDATFSGRTDIWKVTIDFISTRNWITGLGLFHTNSDEFEALILSAFHGRYDTHNGYLTMIMEIGVIGLALWVTVAVQALVKGNGRLSSDPYQLAGIRTLRLVVWSWLFAMLAERKPGVPTGLFFIVTVSALCTLLSIRAERVSGTREHNRSKALRRSLNLRNSSIEHRVVGG